MDGDFEIEVDDETAPDYEIAPNFAENLVDVIRSEMVGNEAQFLALNAAYISGLSREPEEYLQIIVRGQSGEGKTELKQNADMLYPNHWLLRTGSTSDMGLVDSGNLWDGSYVGAFAEFQQIQGKMLEMVKSSAGDDADEDGVGFSHTRNVDDGDGDRDAEEIEKQSMPTIFLFADENNSDIPRELETRQMVIRVESDGKINRSVAKTKFDHEKVEVSNRDYEYQFNFEDGKQAVKNHIANIPKSLDPLWSEDPKQYSYPVVIPHDEEIEWPVDHSEYDTFGWDAFKVVDDILSYKKTQSKRAAQAIANHVRAHTRMNYHNRETMEINGVTHYVADPQDLGNVLSYRDLLLAVTHDINEQKLAVIESLTDEVNGVGGVGPNGGLQATAMDIAEYIEEYAAIPSLSKSQLTNSRDQGVLDEMEEDYLIEVHEGDGPNGAHLYEFLGGSTFGHPNLDVYPELFSEVDDPIRNHSIARTVAEFEESLSMQTAEDLMGDSPLASTSSDDDDDSSDEETASDDLSAFTDDEEEDTPQWDEVDRAVHERLEDIMDDIRAEASAFTSGTEDYLTVQHMLGITPVDYYTDDRGLQYVRAAKPKESEHRVGTIMDASHSMWGDKSDGQVEERIKHSIHKFRQHDVLEVFEDGPDTSSGSGAEGGSSSRAEVEENDENDDKYLLVRDLE